MKKKITHIIGIDEAGRGPLAGPVAVGAVCVPSRFDWGLLRGVGDSKKISPKERESLFLRTEELKERAILQFQVSMVSAKVIDRIGIVRAVRLGIVRSLDRLNVDPGSVLLKLDGLLTAPGSYQYQETIVHGDAREKVIGLASIMAKVTRDRYMIRKDKEFPLYGFEMHKGYGTKRHRSAVKRHRVTPIHRRSFCRNLSNL